MDTPVLLISDRMRPKLRTGQTSMELYETKTMNSPSVIFPATASSDPTTMIVITWMFDTKSPMPQ